MAGLIPFLPFIGFLINGLWYLFGQCGKNQKAAGARVTGTIASIAIGLAFICSVLVFMQLTALPETSRFIEVKLFSWIYVDQLKLDFGFRIDPLTSVFLLIITGVGTLIHIYSIGYMDHDEAPGKYFAYLNLFCFAMLVLVMGDSLPMLFLGWEGVGLCSYLLIGFWYTDMDKAIAGKKAFVVNRIGDLGFLLGSFLIFWNFGTLNFAELNQVLTGASVDGALLTTICLLLFLGCAGKSAQFPLYIWLPDAMAGPTPVSALIHAATMVTSGIYLLARLNFMVVLSPDAMMVIAWVGVFTAFLAATMAITQTDIKKVLAYSTVSQLGYMFLACGVGAFSVGVFHVMTHAFFKALLFMGAGSVIMGMHHEQDIMKMGGLKKDMPKTFFVMAIATYAIAGGPFAAGFFSKDEILWKTFNAPAGGTILWVLALLTAFMTAFYMTRMLVLTFFGKFRGGSTHAHESPMVMIAPLMVLAFLSIVGGYVEIPWLHVTMLSQWFAPVIPTTEHHADSMEFVLMAISVVVAAGGAGLAWIIYRDGLKTAEDLKKKWSFFHQMSFNKWFIDEFFEALVVKPMVKFSQALWRGFDVAVIDQLVLGFGKFSFWAGQTIRVLQTGSIQIYAIGLVIGLIFTMGWLIYGVV